MAPCKSISLQQMSTGSSPTPGNASLTLHPQGSCVPVGSGTRTPLPVPPLTLMWPWWVGDRGGNHSCLRCGACHYHTAALGEAGEARIESARKAVGGSLSLHSACGGAGEDVWRGFWNTHSGWMKHTAFLLLSGFCWDHSGEVCEGPTPVHWFIAHGRARASILWKSFPVMPSLMFQATPDGCVKLPDSLAPAFPSKSTWYHTQSKSITWNIYCSIHCSFLFLSPSPVRWSICLALVHGLWKQHSDEEESVQVMFQGTGYHHPGFLREHMEQSCVQVGNKLLIWKASLLALCILYSPVTWKKSQLGPPNWGGRRRLDQTALLSAQGCCFISFFNKYFMNLNLANISIFFLI